ncbi:Hint domain-containing protein [Myxococcus sp. K38C18041901]|uniref:Hint domain-containing protein n=1 Tax=Myxococcus guangdongensis TaxID=2906760 RepID=UPI0020A7E112|nr:Hint domain-containing protein [Myxococcus guangdongensis]MCP3057901.1 Hint domain-containing protein [Myxococcus guangdongensis]
MLPGCPWVIKPTPKPKTVEEQREVVMAAFQKRPPHEDFVMLDLADDDQYEYARHRLQEAAAAQVAQGGQDTPGPTVARDFARALKTLDVARAKAVRGGPRPKPTDWDCDHFIHVNDSRTVGGGKAQQADKAQQDNRPSLILNPYATCAGGATHVFTDVTAYDSDLSGKKLTVLAKSANEEHHDGKTFDDTAVSVRPSMAPESKVVVESLMVAHNEQTGEEHVSFASLDTTLTPEPVSFTMDHPRFASNEPRSNINLTTCQLRGGADCDYAMVTNAQGTLAPYPQQPVGLALRKTGNPWTGDPAAYFPFQAGQTFDITNIYVPTQLTFDAGAMSQPCVIQAMKNGPTTTRMRLIKTDSGGTCTTLADLSDLFVINGKTASIQRLVNLSQNTTANGGAGCTMEKIVNEPVVMSMTLYSMATCGGAAAVPRLTTFTSTALPTNPFNLNVLNSCMAEGTKVTLADGTRAAIETLKVGDKVRSNASGRVLTVQDFIFGREPKPLVRLRDDQGHDLRLTEKHPVLLTSGLVVPADKVQVKDQVRTESGTAFITATERVPYDGKVYNLKLGTPEELESLGPNERTLFADGVLVGDDTMQRELTSPRRASATP